MVNRRYFVALVASAGVLVAAGLLVLTVLLVQERSAEATSPGKPGKIAYSAYDGTNEAIYTIGASGGGNASKVVDNASEPSYSPSSKKIAYLGGTPANPAIYTIGVGGAGEVKVTDTGVADFEPSWGVSSTPQSP